MVASTTSVAFWPGLSRLSAPAPVACDQVTTFPAAEPWLMLASTVVSVAGRVSLMVTSRNGAFPPAVSVSV